MSTSLRILALEPYDGGSHRAFLDGWAAHSRHRWTRLGLPARHWKWRMRQAPITLARQTADALHTRGPWDGILCSDMLNLAEWRGLAPAAAARLPAVVYFHENQLTYPTPHPDARDQHFVLTHLATLFAAREAWFNSDFHRTSFLEALPAFFRQLPEPVPPDWRAEVDRKSRTVHPGVSPLPPAPHPPAARDPEAPLQVLWAGRWEHDKNPGQFFEALRRLRRTQPHASLRLRVVGPRPHADPPLFRRAREEFSDWIDAWGPRPDRTDFLAELRLADVAVSTADHEFFGFTLTEAALAGARPLVPRRLAYPEVWQADTHPERFYDGSSDDLARALGVLAHEDRTAPAWRRACQTAHRRASTFTWPRRAPRLDDLIQQAVLRSPPDAA